MKVAVVSDSRRRGGAARATARVFDVLETEHGIRASWFVSEADGTQDDRTVVFTAPGFLRSTFEVLLKGKKPIARQMRHLFARYRNRRNLCRLVQQYKPDVISLHSINQWTHAELDRTIVNDLCQIAPVVWTLHDPWPLTGDEDYPDAFIEPDCAEDEAFRIIFEDPKRLAEAAELLTCGNRLSWVAPSHWIGGLANRIFQKRLRIEHIPHGVPLERFAPLPQRATRSVLGIPDTVFVVLAVASHLQARRKGFDLLLKALQRLNEDVWLLCAGQSSNSISWPENVHVVSLGSVADDRLLRIVYCAADVLAMPSLAEMFGLVLIEALACATPCVGFRVGGLPDVIRPGVTGELARRGDAEDLALAIRRIKDLPPERREQMRNECRRIVEAEYDIRLEARRYAELFQEVASSGR